MKKLVLSSMFTFTIISSAMAVPAVDAVLAIGYNSLSPSGYLKYGDPDTATNLDLKDDLNLGNSKKVYIYGIVDLPVLPALKVEYFPFQFTGRGNITTGLKFGDLNFSLPTTVETDLKFDQYDVSFYYKLPVPFVKPRFGLSVKYLDGYAQITDIPSDTTEKADITLPIPMIYLGADIRIPLIPKISDVDFDIEGKWIGYNGHSITDLKLLGKVKILGVPLVGGLFAGVGYKYFRIKVNDLDVNDKKFNADMKFKGFVGEVGLEF